MHLLKTVLYSVQRKTYTLYVTVLWLQVPSSNPGPDRRYVDFSFVVFSVQPQKRHDFRTSKITYGNIQKRVPTLYHESSKAL
jgi:hypothetical protein